MAPRTRSAEHDRYPLVAVGYVVLSVAVIAPVAVGVGVVAARLAEPGPVFAVAFGSTVVCAFFSGILAAPDLLRRIRRRTSPRLAAGRRTDEP